MAIKYKNSLNSRKNKSFSINYLCYNTFMKVTPIQQNKYITPKTTGYAATTGIAWSIYSGISKNKSIRKTHKPVAYISAVLTAAHIALIEYNHYKYKQSMHTKN